MIIKDSGYENKISHLIINILIPNLFIFTIDALLRDVFDMVKLMPKWFLLIILLINFIKIILINVLYFKISKNVMMVFKIFFMLSMLFIFYMLVFSGIGSGLIYFFGLLLR